MEFYSFSRIEKYGKCSELYRLHYEKPIPRPPSDTVAMVAGTVTHHVLEQFYGPGNDRLLDTKTLLDIYWEDRLTEEGSTSCLADMRSLAADWKQLHARGTKGYAGSDPILNKAGQFGAAYQKTTAWTIACREINFEARAASIDAFAKTRHKDWANVPMTSVFSESYIFLENYRDPFPHLTTHTLELSISEVQPDGSISNLVLLAVGIAFNGFIDYIGYDSSNRIYIIDHKTSKKIPNEMKVMHWEQLLIYGWAHWMLTGRWPDYIGINAIRGNQVIIAEFKPELALAAVARMLKNIEAIQKRIFIPQNPTMHGSACTNEYAPENNCPYLFHCWPTYKVA